MRVDVAFTPAETPTAPLAEVVDVLRADSTIAQALASGYRRVLCCADIEEARALRESLGEGCSEASVAPSGLRAAFSTSSRG